MIYRLQYDNYSNWITYYEDANIDNVWRKVPELKKYTNKQIRIIKAVETVIYEYKDEE